MKILAKLFLKKSFNSIFVYIYSPLEWQGAFTWSIHIPLYPLYVISNAPEAKDVNRLWFRPPCNGGVNTRMNVCVVAITVIGIGTSPALPLSLSCSSMHRATSVATLCTRIMIYDSTSELCVFRFQFMGCRRQAGFSI